MAGGIAIGARQLLMQYFGGKGSLTQPSVWAVSLHTASPGDGTAINNEVSTSGTAYARVTINAIGGSSPAWSDATSASPTVLANANTLTYPTATGGGFGTVSHFGVCSNASVGSGTLIAYGALTGSVAVGAGVTASFAASALTLTMDHT